MNEYAKERILPKLSQNLQRIREIAHNSSDLLVNEFVLSGLPAALLCCEGMLSTSTITELILRPIVEIQLEHPTAEQIFQHIQKNALFVWNIFSAFLHIFPQFFIFFHPC